MSDSDARAMTTTHEAEGARPQEDGMAGKTSAKVSETKAAPRFPLHKVRMAFRVLVLVLFLADCVRLTMLYYWNLGAIDVNFGRPQLTAGLSPLSGLCDLFVWARTGQIDPFMPASMVIVILGIVLSLLFKRAFCSWMCPVGTILDALDWAGRKLYGGVPVGPKGNRALRVPMVVLGVAVLAIVAFVLPVDVLQSAQMAPYWAVSDMAIILLFIKPGLPLIIVAAVVLGVSLLLGRNFWCHSLCPLGGIYGIVSAASPITVKRDANACIACGACTKRCPAHIEVDTSTASIRTTACTGCMECVGVCPEPKALEPTLGGTRQLPVWVVPAGVFVVWMIVFAVALFTGTWFGAATPQWIMTALHTLR